MTYQDTATQIIKESIKSAIFIDENALPIYEQLPETPQPEQTRSIELFRKFRVSGITLDVHKFSVGDEVNAITTNYLFDRRDLVLLDWKLNNNEGEEYSLKLLADIVKRPHIHFCAIYTTQTKFDDIFWNILSYFSDTSSVDYEDIELELASDRDEIVQLMPEIKKLSSIRFEKGVGAIYGKFVKDHKDLIGRINEFVSGTKGLCALIKAGNAFSKEIKSDEILPCPSMISEDMKTLTIENTLVTILNKDSNKPDNLISNFSNQVSNSPFSFLHLLGLEANQILTNKSAFIDPKLLAISKEGFLFHRNQNKEGFSDFIKDVLIENARLNFRGEKLSLLDDEMLDALSQEKIRITDPEIQAMNVFYNSILIDKDHDLGFGDVFKKDNKFYVCITALCDCLTPKKNKFYFAEGEKIKLNEALKLGDGAFISYLTTGEIVRWSAPNDDKNVALNMPIYIKPIEFTIIDKHIKAGKISLRSLNEQAVIDEVEVEYITTIKQGYTQRIANHAFTYPVRVGIDFVKKPKS
jgi:hypothetical protein